MKLKSIFTSFRFQIIICMVVLLVSVFFYGYLTYSHIYPIKTAFDTGSVTPDLLEQIRDETDFLSRLSFEMIVFTLVVILGILIHVITVSTVSLDEILKGIHALKKGDLRYKIPLLGTSEFGTVASFLNDAMDRITSVRAQLEESSSTVEERVTERTRELQEQEARLMAAINSFTLGFIMTEVDNSILYMNAVAESILGKRKDEISIDFLQNLIGNSFDLVRILEESRKNKKTLEKGDLIFNKHYVRLYFTPVTLNGDTSEVIGSLILIEDVSAEKEEQHLKLDFVSMAAHELRTPLTVIRGYTQLLKDELKKTLTKEQQEYLQRLAHSGDNLSVLIDNMLSVSRIERDMFKINPGPMDLFALIREVVNDTRSQALLKNQTLDVKEPQESPPLVMADQMRIRQVITNLVTNAIKYTPPGGYISVSMEQKFSMMTVSVTDNGPGIPLADQQKLFTKFYRVSGKLEKGTKGTGLGLFISRTIINLHKGDITVKSSPGSGSVFTFTLPIATDAEIAQYKSESLKSGAQARHGIIINTERLNRVIKPSTKANDKKRTV